MVSPRACLSTGRWVMHTVRLGLQLHSLALGCKVPSYHGVPRGGTVKSLDTQNGKSMGRAGCYVLGPSSLWRTRWWLLRCHRRLRLEGRVSHKAATLSLPLCCNYAQATRPLFPPYHTLYITQYTLYIMH